MPHMPKPIQSPNGALTVLQDKFIDAYVSNGGSITKAAIEAGYSEPSARTLGSKLLKDDKVLAEIYRRTVAKVAVTAPRALNIIDQLAQTSRSDKVRLEAAMNLLDRAGVKAPERVDHRVAGEIHVQIDLAG
jgi:phage terminase small subunit